MARWIARWLVIAIFVAILVAVVLFVGRKSSSPPKARPGLVVARLGGDWTTLDPAKARTTNDYQLIMALYDRLVAQDANGRIVPSLATDWRLTKDSIVLQLRDGVTCADGAPLTAGVVAASLRRLGAPETASPYSYRTLGSSGYRVTADDATGRVAIALNRPYSDLLLGLAMPWASIVCPAGLRSPAGLQARPSGSGPFVLESSVRGSSYLLRARPGYRWGPGGMTTARVGFPLSLEFKVINNNTTAANLLLTGGLRVGFVQGQEGVRLKRAGPGLDHQAVLNIGSDVLLFHHGASHPTASAVVRRALALAIDARAYNKAAYFGLGRVSRTLATPNMDCFSEANGRYATGYDPAQAMALLRTIQSPLPPIRIIGFKNQNAGPEYLLEAFRSIGVPAQLVVSDIPGWLDSLTKSGDWDVTVLPLSSVMPSPSIFVGQLAGQPPPAGGNLGHIRNDRFSALAATAAAADPERRCPLWQAAERAMLESGDVKPLAADVNTVFTRGVSLRMMTGDVLNPITLQLRDD